MTILLYRRSLDLRSGTGRLLLMQARGLEALGERVRLVCRRGGLKYFLRTGRAVRYARPDGVRRSVARGDVLVDHELEFPEAAISFVHNVAAEASAHLDRPDWLRQAEHETRFFAELDERTPIVANSELVKSALVARFGLAAERIAVHYPGVDTTKFNPRVRSMLRSRARAALGVAPESPLVGFVTSGDLVKRGLDIFLAAAESIGAALPRARFLVVGSKRLPREAIEHALVADGRLIYRRKSGDPERWMSALDLFLYPARFEEFGMVLMEAQALGVPALTSRRVGAAECLPPEYASWLLDAPEPMELAAKSLELLAAEPVRAQLAAAGSGAAAALDHRRYGEATARAIIAQKRRLR